MTTEVGGGEEGEVEGERISRGRRGQEEEEGEEGKHHVLIGDDGGAYPPLPPLPVLYRAQPPTPGDGSALISKRIRMSPSLAAAVGRTTEADDDFASFADAAAAAKPSEPSSASAATTAMETTTIEAGSDNEEEAVILRSNFVNAGGGRYFGEGDYKDDDD